MTAEEIKSAVDNNLQALAEVVLALEPKVKLAEELISKTVKGLSKYPFLLRAGLNLDVELDEAHYDLKISCIGSEVLLKLQGTTWDELGPREKLLLADMLPSITAYIATEAGKVVNEFPKPSKSHEPTTINLPGDDELKPQPQAKRRWYHRSLF